MSRSIFDFPPEIVVNILSFLPVQALLRFAQTSRYSHLIASSSLHTLSLGIYTTRIAGLISCLSATQYPEPKNIESTFASDGYATVSKHYENLGRKKQGLDELVQTQLDAEDPYRVSITIPDAQYFDPVTLFSFHNALTTGILKRHGTTLRHLELSLWTLTIPIAEALAALPALRSLSIRIEDFPQIRAVPRNLQCAQQAEQHEAWNILTKTAIWAPRLQALRIEGGDINSAQLSALLRRSRWCRELWLCKCDSIGDELWSFFGNEWEQGRAALRILGVMRCGGQLDEEVLDFIGCLNGLQFLSLQGCYGLDSEAIERRNREEWCIQECISPLRRMPINNATTIIEVDPLYM